MPKIILTNIYLVNWYGFTNVKIPIGANLTLITGENECGKSTILDAVKYAFTGDSEFNRSSSVHNIGGSRRTLNSYTRCLTDASAGTYARPVEKTPNVYSHISLEYFDEVNSDYFILGVILETNASNNVTSYWYAMEDTSMENVQYIYQDNNVFKPYDYQKFQKQHTIQLMSRKDALSKFMQMTGLKLAYTEIGKFQRKLRNIMTYNPAAKIQEFIKESVLEAHDVNFDKLRDAKNNIEKITVTLELIKAEVDALDIILKDFTEHEKTSYRLIVDDIKIVYKEVQKLSKIIEKDNLQIDKNNAELKHLNKVISELESNKKSMEEAFYKAKSNLRELDCSKAIEEEKNNQSQLEQERGRLGQEKEALSLFQSHINKMTDMLKEMKTDVENTQILSEIESKNHTFAEKKNAADRLKKTVSDKRDHLIEKKAGIQDKLNNVQKELNHYNEVIEEYEKNKLDYTDVKEQIELISEINREFRKNNINSEAKFAYEYVVKIEDEEWREAVEAFLGIHRYSIIVEPNYFDLANRVLDSSSHRYVELVNTKLLSSKTLKQVENAVVNKLVIKNEIAEKYFSYWLGGIHAVDINEVSKHENAMSKEGKLSRNMAVTFINKKKIKSYCLGQEAIELNKKLVKKKIEDLEKDETSLLIEKNDNDALIKLLGANLEYFSEYNYDAFIEYDSIIKKINESKAKLKTLLDAQKSNMEYQTLSMQVQELENNLIELSKNLTESYGDREKLKTAIENIKNELIKNKAKLQEKDEEFERLKRIHKNVVENAIKEYEDYQSGISKSGDILASSTRDQYVQRKRKLENDIVGGQKLYNSKKAGEDQLPEGIECEGRYLARKNKIWVDNLQDINAKMAEQTRKYESIFKNEFVLSLYQTALDAKKDISEINKELRKLQFSTKYQFDVNLLDDKSDYAKILRYAEYLKKTNKVDDGQMVFGNLFGYEDEEIEVREKEIKEIIN